MSTPTDIEFALPRSVDGPAVQPAPVAAIKIEKGVPMPNPKGGRPPVYPWRDMAVGDSFAVPVPSGRGSAQRSAARLQAKRHGGRYTCRTRVEDGVRVVRIWRTA